jgi:hypothetical protein
MTKPKSKPDGWEATLGDCIREGLNYKDTNDRLVAGLGAEGSVSGAAYQRHKRKITGGKEVDNAIGEMGERLKDAKEPKQKVKLPAWTKGKQTAADTSKLAELINKGLFHATLPLCKNKKLREEDVKEINLGGAVVATVQYFAPGIPLDHPVITLLTRGILFYLAFKRICERIEKIKDNVLHIGGGPGGDINPDFEGKEELKIV